MGMTLFTKNPNSSISDPDFFVPGWDTTGLERMEIFKYGTVGGGNLAVGKPKSTPIADPQMVEGTPFAEMTARGGLVPHVRLGMPDAAIQTWLLLFDPNNSGLNRLVMSSYAGTTEANPPGISICVDTDGSMVLFVGFKNTSDGTYSTTVARLALDLTKPSLIAVTLNGTTATLKNLTTALSATVTLLAGRERAPGPEIYVGKGPATSYGVAGALNRIAAYAVFSRVLSDAELATIRQYLLTSIQAKFPGISF
ncbi:TPA: hypothetical protein L9K74_000007 [Klebsiella pneumoniae]|nr:hypothetical protein [Klebsiella pneumoniae]